MTELAIVILNWNGEEMLRKYLPSVLEYSPEAEVIVADNASTDNSLTVLAELFPDVRVIRLEKNWGFADGYNKALEQVDATYYLLLNSDVRVEQGWLKPLLDYMRTNVELAGCHPKLVSDVNPQYFEYGGASGGFIDRYGYPFCRGRIFNRLERDRGQYNTVMEVFWATGACLMIRRDDYWKAGGLDGRFFAHNEEIDLCWRLNLLNRRVVCVPQSRAYHLGGGTLPKGNPQKTYLNFRNNLTMLYKNLPASELKHVMRVRVVLDYVAALQLLLTGKGWGDCKAIIKARRDFNAWRHDFDADRQRVEHSSAGIHLPGKMGFSVLWQFYAKKKTTFNVLPKY